MKSNHHKTYLGAALMATLCLAAPVAEAHSPRARELTVSAQTVRVETRTLIVIPAKAQSPREFVWHKSTRFIENNHFVDAAALKEGMQVKVYHHSPFIGKAFVTKVVWHAGVQIPPPRNSQQ